MRRRNRLAECVLVPTLENRILLSAKVKGTVHVPHENTPSNDPWLLDSVSYTVTGGNKDYLRLVANTFEVGVSQLPVTPIAFAFSQRPLTGQEAINAFNTHNTLMASKVNDVAATINARLQGQAKVKVTKFSSAIAGQNLNPDGTLTQQMKNDVSSFYNGTTSNLSP